MLREFYEVLCTTADTAAEPFTAVAFTPARKFAELFLCTAI